MTEAYSDNGAHIDGHYDAVATIPAKCLMDAIGGWFREWTAEGFFWGAQLDAYNPVRCSMLMQEWVNRLVPVRLYI